MSTAISTVKDGDTIKLTASFSTSPITISKLAHLNLNGYTLTGDVAISSNTAGTLNISGGNITGNLTVNTANATVNNAATATGTITINNVSGNTWNENAVGNRLIFNDPDAGTKLVLGATARVASITLNRPAVVTIPTTATVGILIINIAGSTVNNAGVITEVEKNADVVINGNAPATVKPGPGIVISVGTQAELESALNNAAVHSIKFTKDIETSSQILVKQANQKIDGGNFQLIAKQGMTYVEPNKSVLTVLDATGVSISNLTVDASAVNTANKWDGLYALQVYNATDVNLDAITVKNADAGLLVNGSQVKVNGITTSDNEFGGIEVSQGKDVTSSSTLTVAGNSTHTNENIYIWTVGNNATVVDAANQYKFAKDIRPGKEQYTNYILASENRDIPFTVLEAPKSFTSKTLTNLDFSTVQATQAQLVSKPVTLGDFTGNRKDFTIRVQKGTRVDDIPVTVSWKLSTDFSKGLAMGSVVESAIQQFYVDKDMANGDSQYTELMSRPVMATGNYENDQFYIGTFSTGSQATITLLGNDWAYFFDNNQAHGTDVDTSKNRTFTISDETNTVTINLTSNFATIDDLVKYINNRLKSADVKANAEKVGTAQFKITCTAIQGNLIIDGLNKNDFFE